LAHPICAGLTVNSLVTRDLGGYRDQILRLLWKARIDGVFSKRPAFLGCG
jgi:hypothetical protein